MTPINFALPGFFKKIGFDGIQEDLPPITDDLLAFFDPDYGVFSDEGNTLAVDGGNIRQMWDRSATGNTLNQTTATSQPIYDTTTFGNGIASIKSFYDSLIPTNELDFDNSTSWTFYHVYKKASNSNIYYWFKGTAGYPRTEHFTTKFQIRGNSGSPKGVNYTDNTDIKIMTITVDRSGNQFKMYINGSYIGASTSSVIDWPVTIGQLYGNGTAIMNSGNVLFYTDRHSADQVFQVSEWLGDKYGILVAPITENLSLYFNPEKEVYSDAGTTLATDGDYIREWDDRSTNDNDLDQPTASSQLKYKTSLLNSKNGVEATSNTDMLLSNTISLQGCTIYAVNKKDNTSAEMMPAGGSGNVTIGNNYSDGNTYLYDGTNVATLSVGHFTDWAVRAYVWDYGTDFEVFENNSSLGSVSATNVGSITIDRLFGRGNGSAGTKNCMEILVFTDTHDATQIEEMTNWLNSKYDVYDAYAPPITDDLEIYFNPDFDVYSDAGTTLATDGDNIRQYNDRSGNDNTAEQTTGSKQPVYSTSTLGNGNASIHIDSSNVFDLTSGITVGSSSHFTYYTVFKKSAAVNNSTLGSIASTYGNRIDLNDSYIQTFDSSTNSFQSYSWSTDLVIITVVVDSSDNSYKLYENGSQVLTTRTRTFGQFDFDQLYGSTGIAGGNIDYGITLMYNGVAHDSTDVGTISDWLNDKYDIYDPYAPPITDDLELYFNPDVRVYSDAGSTLAVDGENIRQIKDRSGNDNTLNQITGSYQPVYSTSTLGNGNSSIHIDASNFFNLSSTVEIGSSDSFTMYVVYKKGTNTRNSVISGPGSSNSDRIDLRVSYVQAFIGGTNSFISHSDNSDLKIITVVVDRSDNTYKVYKDGTSIGSNSRTFGAVDYTKMFGGIITGGNIDYGNVLLYKDAHSSTEVGTMSDWLNEKYDIY